MGALIIHTVESGELKNKRSTQEELRFHPQSGGPHVTMLRCLVDSRAVLKPLQTFLLVLFVSEFLLSLYWML